LSVYAHHEDYMSREANELLTRLLRGEVRLMIKSTENNLEQILYKISQQPDPHLGLKELLAGCVGLTGASRGRLYGIHLEKSKFLVESQINYTNQVDEVKFDFLDKKPEEVDTLLEKAIINQTLIQSNIPFVPQQSQASSEYIRTQLVAPILRSGTCLGAIVLELDSGSSFSETAVSQVKTISSVIVSLLEKRASLTLYKSLQQPIDFTQTFNDYIDDLLLLITDASGMPYIVCRELVDGVRLRCIGQFGFSEIDLASLDLEPHTDYRSFTEAMNTRKTIVEPTMDAPYLANLRERKELWKIRSFVVTPIIVGIGKDCFGTLSFGCECSYNYSLMEKAGFETIANAIGVAITNFRNFHLAQEKLMQYSSFNVSMTAVDVAQAARHEARGIVEDSHTAIANILLPLRTPSKENIQKAKEKVEELDEHLFGITRSLEKIKAATKPPQRELTTVSVPAVWREAFAMMAGRLDNYRIRPKIFGPKVTAEAYKDFLRNAFLQLILNSIDAFKDRKKMGDREIVVTIDPQSESARDIKIRYMDNATGIDCSKLQYPAEVDKTTPLEELIFYAGVTSKDPRAGYGLYLVRKILTDHKGSINLVSHRNGVVFDIDLPKRQPS
jgi:hypothetical protein